MVTGGRSLPLGGARQRAVFALLVIQDNATVSVDRLADQLWAGEPPESAVATLQNYVYRLRRALAGLPLAIETRPPGYALEVDPEAIDARRFERLLDQGRTALAGGEAQTATSILRQALALWHGPALADFAYEPFAEREVARLEELRLTAIDRRIEADLQLERHHELVAELESLVAEHPLREVLRGHLMLALHRSGRRAEALRTYRQGRDAMIEELGIEPGQALQRLEHAILMGDTDLEPSPEHRQKVAPSTGASAAMPVWLTSFVGRDREVERLVRLVGANRLMTLTGPGGSGKTRLAVAVAQALSSTRDVLGMVELAGTEDAGNVASAVAAALGVRVDSDQPPIEAIVDLLEDRPRLLVLDNCEHVLSAVATLVESLVHRCPELHILATSQGRLDLASELVWPVPALPEPDAVTLFSERSAVAREGTTPTDDELVVIRSICRRLDHMPLAIELAAARTRMLPVEQISRRLDDRFRLLSGASRSLPARQRSLLAAMEWSYALLLPEEQDLFERLSVFVTPFGLDAAEAVSPTGDAVDLLASLLDKSFVTRVDDGRGEARFRLLETLRQYGEERAVAGDTHESARRAHARYFASLAVTAASHWYTAARRAWLDRLTASHDDLQRALEWYVDAGDGDSALRLASSLWPYWDFRYLVTEGRGWLRRALDLDASDPSTHLAALVGEAYLSYVDDDLDGAAAAVEVGLGLADRLGNLIAKARLLVTMSEVDRLRNDPAAAQAACAEAVDLYGDAGDTWGEANAMRVLALLSWDRGDLDAAVAMAERCLRSSRDCGDDEGVAGAQSMLAGVSRDRGDLAHAVEFYEASLAGFKRAEEPWGTAHAVHYLGVLALASGDHLRAARLGEESLRLHEELGNRRGVGQALLVLGDAAHDAGRLDEAGELCDRGLAILRARGFAVDLTSALHSMARLALRHGDLERASALAEEALGPYRESGQGRGVGPVLAVLGTARARQGDVAAAVELCEESLALFEGTTNQRGVALALESLAEAVLAADDVERAARTLSAARITRAVIGASLTPVERMDQQRLYDAVRARLGDTDFAREWITEWQVDVIDLRHGARAGDGDRTRTISLEG